jgi:hypothetical protein
MLDLIMHPSLMIHRVTELIKDIGLDSKWKLDEVMVSAIAFILKKWKLLSVYIKILVSIAEMSLYLRSTGTLLAERTLRER